MIASTMMGVIWEHLWPHHSNSSGGRICAQVLEVCDKPVWYKLHQLGTAECHFAYRMVVVMMRRDLPMPKVRGCCHYRHLTLHTRCSF